MPDETMFRPFALAGPLPSSLTVVEASAGTGKTWAIAALAVRYLAEGVVTAPRLLAITFTRLASNDLRSRLYQRLIQTTAALEAHQQGVDASLGDPLVGVLTTGPAEAVAARLARLHQAIGDFDAATIATIHEFCRRAGDWLGPLLGPITPDDENAVEAIADQVVGDMTLQRLLSGTDDLPASECESLGRAALNNPELAIEPSESPASQFALGVRDEYARRKADRGASDYNDLAMRLDHAISRPSGQAIIDALRQRYQVVLVDEFQDTDPVQWSILRQAFGHGQPMVLVGDPKQAIYGFRGADVYAYLDAVRQAGETYTLPVNHRSDELAVQGINAVFSGTDFGQPGAEIPMRTSSARHIEPRLRGGLTSGLEIRRASLAKMPPWQAVSADLVAWVAQRLADPPQLNVDGRWRTLEAGDIAVLVSTNRTGESISQALRDHGVPAVFSGVSSIFASPAVDEWVTLLDALASPRPDTLRRAMAGRLIGLTLRELAQDDDLAAMWAATMRDWSHAVRPAVIVDQLDALADLSVRLVGQPGGERLLTDVRHLAELLAGEAGGSGNPAELAVWLRTKHRLAVESGGGDRSRRLETDRPTVSVMTIHAAKGLEFPVVLVPAAADSPRHMWGSPGYPLIVRRDGRRVIDTSTGGPGQKDRWNAWVEESAADDRRRLYVSLTRASSLAVAWVNDRSSTLAQLIAKWPDTPAEVRLVEVTDLPPLPPNGITAAPPVLAVNTMKRIVDNTWVRTSYSGLTADLHGAISAVPEVGAWDEADGADEIAAGAHDDNQGPLSPMDGLPAGAGFGTIVHAAFEACDPASATLHDDLIVAATRLRERSTLPDLDATHLADALAQVLNTPLGPLADGFSLAELSAKRRLTELGFELPLGDGAGAAKRVADLAALFSDADLVPPDDPLARYGAALAGSSAAERHLNGFLTGSIDNIVELPSDCGPPRVFLIDYKTNRLGPPIADPVSAYTRPAMAAAMIDAHYPLQALLYAVALRRYLAWRRPDVSFDDQWAGVGYLFVRGMSGPSTPISDGMPCGVFGWRPSATMIEAADAVLRGDAS